MKRPLWIYLLTSLLILIPIGHGLDELKNAGLIPRWLALFEGFGISVVISGEAHHRHRSQKK